MVASFPFDANKLLQRLGNLKNPFQSDRWFFTPPFQFHHRLHNSISNSNYGASGPDGTFSPDYNFGWITNGHNQIQQVSCAYYNH
jgi:hypothetical protein